MLCAALAFATDTPLIHYLTPAFIHLLGLLLLTRLFIAQKTYKFHSMDCDLLFAVSPFSQPSRYGSTKGQEEQLRMARIADKVSRQLALLIYVVGVLLSAVTSNPLWLGFGATACNLYRVEESENGVEVWVERKLKVKPRLMLSVPLLMFLSRCCSQDYSPRHLL